MTGLPVIALVDDEERILRSLRMLFRGRAEVLATTSGAQVIEWVRQRRVHVVVSDQRMPGMGGVEVLREVARHSPSTMRMLLTGYADMDAVSASVNEGEVYRFLEKPWDGGELVASVLEAARIADEDFEARVEVPVTVASRLAAQAKLWGERIPAPPQSAQVLALDASGAIAAIVEGILPGSVGLLQVTSVPQALEALVAHDVAVIVAVLAGDAGHMVDAIKRLKRLRPATLVIVVSPMHDSRLVIGLINEGQIFRFLLAPAGRELLRRCLIAALERHAQLRAAPRLQRRHDVQVRPETTLTGRLLDVWRRLREVSAR